MAPSRATGGRRPLHDNMDVIEHAIRELEASNLHSAAEALVVLWNSGRETARLGRMAMLKACEAELKSELRAYVDPVLYAKRKVTGSGTAGAIMTVAQIGVTIAAACCSGGAALGLGLAAGVLGKARTNENVLSSALELSGSAQSSMKDDGLASEDQLARHSLGNEVAGQSVALGELASSRFAAMQEKVDSAKHWYDYKKLTPPCGSGAFELAELKRKSTAWKHHGAGGTFAIEHDFAVATGLAYGSFLKELRSGKHADLLRESEAHQVAHGLEAHLITRYILNRACGVYARSLRANEAAYATLMNRRGSRTFGYSGGKALNAVTQAVLTVEQLTGRDLKVGADGLDLNAAIDRIRV